MERRKIIFKAKKLSDGKWVNGDLLHRVNKTYIYKPHINERGFLVETEAVDPSTVCQFTGLKDTNDVPFFEGDIIDFGGEGEVVFKDGAFYAKFGKYTECLLCNLVKSGQPVTIVGNKFDKEK